MAEASRRTLEVAYHGLRTKPFRENTDPAFLWLGLPYRDALNKLRTGVLQNAGVLLLTGEVGVGKTMLARAVADRLTAEGIRVAKLGHALLQPDEFRNSVARAFGVPAPRDARDSHAAGFAEFLRAAHALGERALLIIDEAQNLDAPLLDAVADLVRMGREAGHGTVNVLNVLLVAQPGIDPILKRRKRQDGADLVVVRAHLGPLDVAQVGDYVAFRLRAAGADREIFSFDAIGEIAALSGGVPRLINQICDRTLLATSAWNGCMVSAGVVRGAQREVDPAAASAGRRLFASPRARGVVYAGCLVVATGLGVFLYHGFRPDGVVHAPARDDARSPGTEHVASPPAAPATEPVTASAPPANVASDGTAPSGMAPTPDAPSPSEPTTHTATTAPPPTNPAANGAATERIVTSAPTRRGANVAERPAPSRAIANPSAPRPQTRIENAQVVKPRATPVTPTRAPAPPTVAGPAPAPVTSAPAPSPVRDRAPELAPPPQSAGSDTSEDPSAIIHWLLQRNPAAGR